MDSNITISLVAQFKLQTNVFSITLNGISDADSEQLVEVNLNPLKWLAGHLLNTRLFVISLLSHQQANSDYAKFFGKGTFYNSLVHYPSLDEILNLWSETSTKLVKLISESSESTLLAKAPFQTSIPDETLLGLIGYMAHHEAHHLGQMSIIKKLMMHHLLAQNS